MNWFQPREALDNYDTIEWLAAQPASDGRIAQMVASYGSITAYRAAALKPPHLATIVPVVSPTNIYAEWIYFGDVPSGTNMAWWASEAPIVDTAAHARTPAPAQPRLLEHVLGVGAGSQHPVGRREQRRAMTFEFRHCDAPHSAPDHA